MLDPAPFASVDQIQIMQPFMQRITKRTIEIAEEKDSVEDRSRIHAPTVPKLDQTVHCDRTDRGAACHGDQEPVCRSSSLRLERSDGSVRGFVKTVSIPA